MGLLGDWVNSKRMENPVRGQAQVVSSTQPPDGATSGNVNLNLVVTADGIEPTAVEYSAIAPVKRWPFPGTMLPVTVDLANPERLKIEWDEIPTHGETSKQQAQALADAMAGKGGDPSAAGIGGENIVIQGGQVDDATRAQLAGMGVDVDALMQQAQAMQQQSGAGAQPAAGGASSGGGDIVDQLEQLNQLRGQGALTDDEFESAKKKLLGG